jgi:MoxR-vWA-beta-propeller ternary system domain bpX2
MSSWAACIPVVNAAEVAAMRLFSGIECAEVAGTFWIRGSTVSEQMEKALRSISGLQCFELLESGWLKSPESRIPERMLPKVAWQSLRTTILPALPTATLPGETRQKLPVTLVRSYAEQEAAALLADFAEWAAYAAEAPEVRLKSLRFAVNEERKVLIIGQPLPPLKGLQLANYSGILVPCGLSWSPAVDAAVLSELFHRGAEDFVICFEDHTHQLIKPEQLVSASRSAVRATQSAMSHV